MLSSVFCAGKLSEKTGEPENASFLFSIGLLSFGIRDNSSGVGLNQGLRQRTRMREA